MRINTDGKFEWRGKEIEETADLLGMNKTTAILAACEHVRQDHRAKQQALEHPDMTEDLAEILSTPTLPLTYELETGVDVD